ncbi:Crp/Fnr family transcriptional regulator [Flavobacterium sp. RHBU_3]|uniref:Crp/Fnr family transcriptional regulator n=1 Tax=Flavobacterium sp. RHBU_3 TaxID=3391184 RepID=UPI00398521AB
MFELFKDYLLSKVYLTAAELDAIERVCEQHTIPAGETVFTEGSYWFYNGFVCSGLVYKHTLDLDNQLKVIGFSSENYWVGDRKSLLTQSPMPFTVTALEDTTLIYIENNVFEQLCIEIPAFNDMTELLVQRHIEAMQKQIADHMVLSDEERYAALMNKRPTLCHRVPPALIASYLDICTESMNTLINGIPWPQKSKG